MDWERIERDVNNHTQALISGGSSSYLIDRYRVTSKVSSNLGLPPAPSSSAHNAINNNNNPSISSSGSLNTDLESAVMRELSELRHTTQQQAKRMAIMEKMLNTYSESIETVNNLQFGYSERLDTLEHEYRVNSSAAAQAARERAELNIQTKTITGRLQALEDAVRGQENQYASKESFAQLLDTTVEQIRALSTISENARQRSTQSITLTEALIQALYELNSGPSGFRLDFLTSLSSGERQREQIVRLLIDALQQAISVSVRNQFTPAIECMSNLFRPQIETIKGQQEELGEDLRNRISAVQSSLQNRVDRNAETVARLDGIVHSCETSTLDCSTELHKLKEVHSVAITSIQGIRETLAAQRNSLDVLAATQHNRQSYETERAAMREAMRTLTGEQAGSSEQIHQMRLDYDGKMAEMLRAQERARANDVDHARKAERMEGQLKGDIGTLGLSQQSLHAQFDVITKDFSVRTQELDRSFTELYGDVAALKKGFKAMESVKPEVGSGSPTRGSASAAIAAAATIKDSEMMGALESLRQSMVSIAMELDDVRQQQTEFKAAFRAVDDDFARLTKSTSNSVSAVKEGMDTLQHELVSLSDTRDAMSVHEGKIAELRKEVLRLATEQTVVRAVKSVEVVQESTRAASLITSTPPARRASIATMVTSSSLPPSPSVLKKSTWSAVGKELPKPSTSKMGIPSASVGTPSGFIKAKSVTIAGPPLASVESSRKPAIPIVSKVKSAPKSVATQKKTKAAVSKPIPVHKIGQAPLPVKSAAAPADSESGSDLEARFLDSGDEDDDDDDDEEEEEEEEEDEEKDEDEDEDSIVDLEDIDSIDEIDLVVKDKDEDKDEDKVTGFCKPEPDDIEDSFDPDSSDDDDILGREILSPEQRSRSLDKQQALQQLRPLQSQAPSAYVAAPVALSGSLLSGRSSTSGIKGSATGKIGASSSQPLFVSELVLGKEAAAETAAAARRAMDAATALKKESVQCTHCLRRLPKVDIVTHVASCELRSEPCPLGCGASVRFLKMEQHLSAACPKKR